MKLEPGKRTELPVKVSKEMQPDENESSVESENTEFPEPKTADDNLEIENLSNAKQFAQKFPLRPGLVVQGNCFK